MSFDSSSVLAVGTVAFDSIKTPFGSRERIVGGAGTYIGWSASTKGVRTGLVSIVGDDFPQEELNRMEAAGMLVEGIERKAGGKSFFWSGSYHMDMNGRDTLATELNVLADFNPVIPEAWRCAKWLMLGNIDPKFAGVCFGSARRAAKPGGIGHHELLDGHRHGATEGGDCAGRCSYDQ